MSICYVCTRCGACPIGRVDENAIDLSKYPRYEKAGGNGISVPDLSTIKRPGEPLNEKPARIERTESAT